MNALLLLLLDSRSPAGAHNHSAGMEAAITTGLVSDQADVERFCRGRLHTAGRVAADFAAAACTLALDDDHVQQDASGRTSQHMIHIEGGDSSWIALEAEFEARTPSEAIRAASRQLGRGLTRMVRSMLPSFDPAATHHPLVLGAAVAAADGTPQLAARAAALGVISVPASAAVRLLGLDPFAMQGLLARLAAEIDAQPPSTGLSAHSAPHLDLLSDFHLSTEVRLFAS